MYESCLKKQEAVKTLFNGCTGDDALYLRIIELGRKQPPLAKEFKTAENIVNGCQSTVYLRTSYENGVITFQAESDALISAGLAALLVAAYNGESPETILKCPPSFLNDLKISSSLTPNRASGLYSIHLRMKQEALKALVGSKE